MTEKERIQKVLNGETAAFEYFVNTYQDMALTIAMRICKNRKDAEDIVQESFVKAYHNLHHFQQKSKFSSWMYRIVYNTAISTLRKSAKHRETVDYSSLEDSFSTALSGLEQLEIKEQKQIIQEALQQLPGNEGVILTLYYFEENTIKEVAKIVGLSPANIKIKLFRGRKRLAKLISISYKK